MRYTCPCCGYRTFPGPPGTEEVCAVCSWRDDVMHLRFPQFNGRPNTISLVDAQMNFSLVGFPSQEYQRDPDWRAIDPDVDVFEAIPNDFDGLAEPEDTTTLYYWLPRA